MQDKIYGILIGAAVGDALGAPHEFQTLPYTGQFQYKSRRYQRFQKVYIVHQCGQYTDDTEMMMCLARSLNNYSQQKAVMEYLEWCNSGVKSCGKNTKALFKGVKTFKGYQTRAIKQFENNPSQSNGALMRCAIIATKDNWEEIAVEDCSITNPDSICIEINLVYLLAVRTALLGCSDRKSIFETAKEYCIEDEVKEILFQVEKGEFRDVTKSKGWCKHGFYCAFYSLLYCNSYKSAIDWTIKLGGDTDTNACIVGALWGALEGFQKINSSNKELVDTVLNCTTEAKVTETEIPTARPEKYRAHNLKILAEELSKK